MVELTCPNPKCGHSWTPFRVSTKMKCPKCKSKYKNRICRCKLGHTHKSRAEVPYCDGFRLLKRQKKILDFVYEKGYDLHGFKGQKVCRHYPDFTVTNLDGSKDVFEIKGFAVEVWRIKSKLFVQEYGGTLNYQVVRV